MHLRCLRPQPGNHLGSTPGSNVEFWHEKLTCNVERDAHKENQLRPAGWRVEIVRECEARDPVKLKERLRTLPLP